MIQRRLRATTTAESEQTRLPLLVDICVLLTVLSAAVVGFSASDYFTRLTMLGGVVVSIVVWRYLRDPVVIMGCTTMVFGAVLGWGFNFYDHIWWYDKFAHFLFSLVGTMAIARLVLHKFRAESVFLLLTALWLSWLGIGSLWEIGEWVSDRVQDTRHSRGYFDTLFDMIWNSVGAGVGAWMYWSWFRTDADKKIIIPRHEPSADSV